MNERIKELAKQAGLKSEIMVDESNRDIECFLTQYDASVPSIHYWEKFAELIVRECMDCSTWVGKVNKNAKEPIHTAHAINQRIKQHFGIQG